MRKRKRKEKKKRQIDRKIETNSSSKLEKQGFHFCAFIIHSFFFFIHYVMYLFFNCIKARLPPTTFQHTKKQVQKQTIQAINIHHMHTHTHIHIRTHIQTHIHIRTYTHTYTHTCIHTYTNRYTKKKKERRRRRKVRNQQRQPNKTIITAVITEKNIEARKLRIIRFHNHPLIFPFQSHKLRVTCDVDVK